MKDSLHLRLQSLLKIWRIFSVKKKHRNGWHRWHPCTLLLWQLTLLVAQMIFSTIVTARTTAFTYYWNIYRTSKRIIFLHSFIR